MIEPRVVPAGRGAAMVGRGFGLFRSAIGTWIGIMMISSSSRSASGSSVRRHKWAHWLLTPVFMGGLMPELRGCATTTAACLASLRDSRRFVPLMIIGAVNIGVALAVVALAGVSIVATMHLSDAREHERSP